MSAFLKSFYKGFVRRVTGTPRQAPEQDLATGAQEDDHDGEGPEGGADAALHESVECDDVPCPAATDSHADGVNSEPTPDARSAEGSESAEGEAAEEVSDGNADASTNASVASSRAKRSRDGEDDVSSTPSSAGSVGCDESQSNASEAQAADAPVMAEARELSVANASAGESHHVLAQDEALPTPARTGNSVVGLVDATTTQLEATPAAVQGSALDVDPATMVKIEAEDDEAVPVAVKHPVISSQGGDSAEDAIEIDDE